MNLQVRHYSERRARKLKIGELTVHGLNFWKLLEFLKNLHFWAQEVVSKSKKCSKSRISFVIPLQNTKGNPGVWALFWLWDDPPTPKIEIFQKVFFSRKVKSMNCKISNFQLLSSSLRAMANLRVRMPPPQDGFQNNHLHITIFFKEGHLRVAAK